MRRKLSLICFLCIAGIYAAFLHPAASLLFGAALVFILYICPFPEISFSASLKKAAVLAFFLGILVYSVQMDAVRTGHQLDGIERVWTAEVLSSSRCASGKTRILCRLDEKLCLNDGRQAGEKKHDGDILQRLNPYRAQCVYLYTDQTFRSDADLTGAVIRFTAKLEEPKGRRNPQTFDYRQYLRSRGITHTAWTDGTEIMPVCKSVPARLKTVILKVREEYLNGLMLGEKEQQLLSGVLFGMTETMPEDMKETFRENGTAHILAVSGLHVGVIYGMHRRLTRNRKRKGSGGILLLFLFFYGCLTLWTVSVVRAILLIVLLTLGDRLGRRYDLLTSLSFTAALIALKNPCAVLGASFQMSFLAVGSMSFFTPILIRKLPPAIPRELPSALAVQIGTVPYCAFMFNQLALAALLCNIPVLFLLGILVPTGIAGIPAVLLLLRIPPGRISFCLLQMIRMLLQTLSRSMLLLNQLLSQNGKFCADVISLPAAAVLAVYLILFFCCSEFCQVHRLRGHKQMLAAMLCILLSFCAVTGCCLSDDFRKAGVVFVDVGQGDCVHVRGKKNVLLDGGGSVRRNIGKQVLKPYLLKNGCRSLDAAMATHLHVDHYLGLQQLQEIYPIRQMVTKGKCGKSYDLGGGDRIDILWPEYQDPDETDENMNSLIFKVYIDGFTILVTGDLGEVGEQKLLEKYRGTDRLHCDILKVGHHGSRYSTTEEFLDAVRPSIAVIGVGKNNTYGHPGREVLQRLEKRGIPVYRTDQDGAVGIWKDGKGRLRVCTVCQEQDNHAYRRRTWRFWKRDVKVHKKENNFARN